jgi:hypothetical protein
VWLSPIHSGGFGCVVRAQAPVPDQRTMPMILSHAAYLLLQAHYTGPLFLQQALILLARRIVEGIWDVRFLSKGSRSIWCVDYTEVCDYGLVPALTISGVFW